MKKIGLSPCFMYPNVERIVFGRKSLNYYEKDMVRYVAREGVMPILIPDLADQQLDAFLAELDGVVFQGGTDLAPESYGETPIGRWKGDAERDAYELKIMEKAMRLELPILGICRGMQLMNVFFGGTLYQDIATQQPHAIAHRDAQLYDQIAHEIDIVPNSLLAQLHQNDPSRWINTVHHQGVKDLGKDLAIMASSKNDGIVEAIMHTQSETGKVMGVQWHPEFFWNYQGKPPLMNAFRVLEHFLTFC